MRLNEFGRLSLRLLAGFAIGAGLGLLVRAFPFPHEWLTLAARWAGEIFLRSIFMLILPLIIPTLLLGLQRLAETGAIGRIGLPTLLTVVTLTTIAATIGLVLANLIAPAHLLSASARTALIERFGQSVPTSRSLTHELFLNLIPKNPFYEIANAFTPNQQGGLLAVVLFTIAFGIALTHLPSETTRGFYHLLEVIYEATVWLLRRILKWLGPLGVGGLIFQAVEGLGWEIFPLLSAYAATVALGLLLHGAGVYSLFLWLFSKVSPLALLRGSMPALVLAFSSASSNATLPTTLEIATRRLGIAAPVAQFILTLGATVNQNGTALYEGVTLLFLMQVFGVPLSGGEQLLLIGLAVLIAIGAAGVPGGSLPLLAGVLPAFGVPPGAIALIYGIDRFLDMLRTTVNVYGDIVIATYIHRLSYGNPPDASKR
ncbi:MAG: dicarboxylate/amino acid:cation symporter [Bacteroidia bacterium]|nr:dicarboxylate/amino acid:cation symporter [Bacteroidia bacterium]MDW8088604.1 dicarboxylate/amino acid:cation symporter [Bacteroidia bacterium]